jgi:ribosomal protein L24
MNLSRIRVGDVITISVNEVTSIEGEVVEINPDGSFVVVDELDGDVVTMFHQEPYSSNHFSVGRLILTYK